MACRSAAQVEHMFRLNVFCNPRRYARKWFPEQQHTLEEVLPSITADALQQWWADRSARPEHPAAEDDDGRRYLRFIDCRAAKVADVEHHVQALGWDCGTVPLGAGWLAVYVRPREE